MSLTGFLSYSRVNWQQSPSKSTPLSAANLNIMDAGIKNNNDMISNLRDEVTQLNSNIGTSAFIRNISGKDGDNAIAIIKQAAEKGTFSKNGIYSGWISRGPWSAYIGMSVGNYMGFIVYGYSEKFPMYILNINNNWTYENLATTTKSTITYGNTIITYVPSIGMVNIKPNKLTNSVQIINWTSIVEIPEQYRPSRVIQFPVAVYNPESFAAYGQLTTDGKLQIYSDTPIKKDQGQAYYNFTYFI